MIRPNRTPTADPPRRRRRKWLILAALLVLLGWWLWPDGRLAKARGLRDELFSEAGQALTPEERQSKFSQLRTVTREMSDAQRRELSKDMLRRREDVLRKYAELSPAEKKQRLDKDLDRQEERRRQQAQNPPGTTNGGPRGAGGFGGPGGPRPGRPSTPEDRERRRQLRLDATTPEFRELTDQYRRDMAARRQERGLPPIPPRVPRN